MLTNKELDPEEKSLGNLGGYRSAPPGFRCIDIPSIWIKTTPKCITFITLQGVLQNLPTHITLAIFVLIRDIKNPHFAGIPTGITPFGALRSRILPRGNGDGDGDKSPPIGGSGTRAGITLPARVDRTYMKRPSCAY